MTDEETIERERPRLRAAGWTDRDIDEYVRRHGTHFLGLLRPLPRISDGDGLDRDVLRKVRALLAKAESTTFPEEAEACNAKAQELMTRHRIDHLGDVTAGVVGGRRIWLDAPYTNAKFALVASVGRANGCRAIHMVGLGCVHLFGLTDDLEVTEMLFTSLLLQAGRFMAVAEANEEEFDRRFIRSFRASFLEGFAWRIGERLAESTATVTAACADERADLLPVLVRRDELVEAAVHEAFPDTRARRASISNGFGAHAGVKAADRADLGRSRVNGGRAALTA
jgi:hypothetical protein